MTVVEALREHSTPHDRRRKSRKTRFPYSKWSCGGRTRTDDLWVMSSTLSVPDRPFSSPMVPACTPRRAGSSPLIPSGLFLSPHVCEHSCEHSPQPVQRLSPGLRPGHRRRLQSRPRWLARQLRRRRTKTHRQHRRSRHQNRRSCPVPHETLRVAKAVSIASRAGRRASSLLGPPSKVAPFLWWRGGGP
jgi:hypothetical protein